MPPAQARPLAIATDVATGTWCWVITDANNGSLKVTASDATRVFALRSDCTGQDAHIVGIDAGSGHELWRHNATQASTAALAGGLVIVDDGAAPVTALDPKTGTPKWTATVHGAVDAASRDAVVVTTRSADPSGRTTVAVLESTDGRVRWQHEVPQGAGAAVSQSTVMVTTFDPHASFATTTGYDINTGHQLWLQPRLEPPHEDLNALKTGSGVPIGTDSSTGLITGINVTNGNKLWSRDGLALSTVDDADATVYLRSNDATSIAAVDPHTGTQRWSIKGELNGSGDGIALIIDQHAVRAIDAATGRPRWSVPLASTPQGQALNGWRNQRFEQQSAVVAGGRLIAGFYGCGD